MNEDLEKIITKYDFPQRNESSSYNVSDIELYSNIKLPEDYIFYLEKCLGINQFIGVKYINLWPIEEIIDFNKCYGIVENLNNTIGIGSNGGGEFIGILIEDNGSVRIILSPFIDLDSNYNVEIGTSFTDFLVRLDNKIEWF